MNLKLSENIFMQLAELIASCSYDPKTKVGTVLVSLDYKHIYATGYNAKGKGLNNERYSLESGKSLYIHSEINALINSLVIASISKIAFVTHKPCEVCAQALLNGGVKEIHYLHDYPGITEQILPGTFISPFKYHELK